MGQQRADQETQVGKSDVFEDTKAAGPTLETDSENLRDDLNALRSQVRRVMYGSDPGKWTDDPETAFGTDATLKGLVQSGASFDENDILVAKDGSIVVSESGNVLRRK
jgi:hypothetical protein